MYYFVSHPEEFVGKKVLVVGGGDTAIDAALKLLNLADEITVVHGREGFRAFDENVEIVRKSGMVDFVLKGEVIAIKGRHRVEKAVIRQDGKKLEKSVDAVIIATGLIPNNEIFKDLGLTTDERGFIMTDRAQRTNIEGIFAVGDVVHGGLHLITVTASHGPLLATTYTHMSKNPTGQEKLGLLRYRTSERRMKPAFQPSKLNYYGHKPNVFIASLTLPTPSINAAVRMSLSSFFATS